MAHYTATVTFRVRTEVGDLEVKTVGQDVSDDVAEMIESGVSFAEVEESLVDRVYWKQVHGAPRFFDIVGGELRVV